MIAFVTRLAFDFFEAARKVYFYEWEQLDLKYELKKLINKIPSTLRLKSFHEENIFVCHKFVNFVRLLFCVLEEKFFLIS